MNEHHLDKAMLCDEIEQRDLRIKNLEICEDARARTAGRTLKFAMARGFDPASDEDELEYIMRRFDELAVQVGRLRAEFPLFDDNGLSEQEHCCEFTLLQERKRLHALLPETSPTALAALKTQWQADGVLKFAGHAMVKYRYNFCDWAKLFANELRQRAQEARDEQDAL